jgi:hypothetical protein
MEYNLVCEDLADFFPFQNIHVENVHTDQNSKNFSESSNLKPTEKHKSTLDIPMYVVGRQYTCATFYIHIFFNICE